MQTDCFTPYACARGNGSIVYLDLLSRPQLHLNVPSIQYTRIRVLIDVGMCVLWSADFCEHIHLTMYVGADERTDNAEDADEVFRCPCGKCSLESYLESGCPKSNSISFPYLNIGMLDEDEKEDLTAQLFDDTSEMIASFAKLLDEICVSLERRGVSVERLAMRAITLGAYESENIQKPLLKEDEKELKSSKTIDGAFFILRPHMSFFNFELLKYITECRELCSDSDRKHMEEYVSKFSAFCKHKVFEVPPGVVGEPTSKLKKCKRKAFVVLMTKHETEPNLVFVNAAKRKIAKLLKLKPSTLHLHRIDEGSLIFVFSVPNFVARKLFPLKPSVVAKLKNAGFLLLTSSAVKDKGIMYNNVCWVLQKYYRRNWLLSACAYDPWQLKYALNRKHAL